MHEVKKIFRIINSAVLYIVQNLIFTFTIKVLKQLLTIIKQRF